MATTCLDYFSFTLSYLTEKKLAVLEVFTKQVDQEAQPQEIE